MKTYLTKRKGSATADGFIKKQNNQLKEYIDIMNTPSDKKFPSSKFIEIGDVIFVSEAGDGIYGRMEITEIPEIKIFNDIFEVIKFAKKSKDPYITSKMFVFAEKYKENNEMKFKYVKYKGKLKILDRIIPFNDDIEKYKFYQDSLISLSDEDIEYLKSPNYKVKIDDKLSTKIPVALRLSCYGFFGTEHNLGKIIDIDHFVPKSIEAPGGIIENLVPIGLNFNRAKSDSIPRTFFLVAKSRFSELDKKVDLVLTDTNDFIKPSKISNSHKLAREITSLVKDKGIDFAKKFYNEVSESFYPAWTKYRNEWNKNNF